MLVTNVFVECVEGKIEEVYQIYEPYKTGKINHEGNISIKFFRNDNEVLLIENWEDEDSLNRFFATEEAKEIMKKLDGKTKSIKMEKYFTK